MDPFENPYATSPTFSKDLPAEHPDSERDFDRVLYSLTASRFLVTSIVVLMGIKAVFNIVMISLSFVSIINWGWSVNLGRGGPLFVIPMIVGLVVAILQMCMFFILMRYRSALQKVPLQPVARTVFIALEQLRVYWKVLAVVLVVEVLNVGFSFLMQWVRMYF